MIRNLVLDMGNVLLNYTPRHFIEREGISDPAEAELLMREVFQSVEWSMMDWGAMTEEEVEPCILARLPERLHAAANRFIFSWNEPAEPIEGMAALIRECRERGMGIYLLSNASERLYAYFGTIPGNECFDGLVVSATEKCVKPMPEIYRRLLEKYDLKAEECLFVDDIPINVSGAILCGMQGHVFDGNVEKLRAALGAAPL